MLNSELWKSIESFNLDYPVSEYGFSTRLAEENEWTANFAAGAIIEYKKFMFLAATSEYMVSPSEIVDVVWHQHLVFTQSYNALCNILGRKIDHIPSTRNKTEFDKFKQARERTSKYYSEVFGEQPAIFWNYDDMYAPLALEKASMKTRTFLLIALLVWLVLLIPAYFFLRPVYIQIDPVYFLTGYLMISILVFVVLGFFNRNKMDDIVQGWTKEAFIFNLTAMEVVYLKRRNIDEVVHGYVSHMVDEGIVEIVTGKKLSLIKKYESPDAAEFVIAEAIKESGEHGYRNLLAILKRKPAITNVANSMNELEKYILKSRMFSRLFSLNVIVLGFIFMLGSVRMITGLERDKPVGFLFVILLGLGVFAFYHLFRLSKLMTSDIIPGYYMQKIVPDRSDANNWDWTYLMLGTAVLAETFMPVYYDATGTQGSDGSSGSGCGSGCGGGGSCGGGCGGCGGG